jgi:3'-phosphoadenosine 5'-phosphosulfate sulfotransferase (PAPS reductase)/FAD synthetase
VNDLQRKLAGRRVVASISGGKDSAAMSLHLRELGIEHDRVFMDTGWEHEKTYEYLRGELTRVIGPITEIRAPLDMQALILKKGMFPSKRRRFCTQELKVFPMQRHLRSMSDAGEEVINCVGIRAAESEARSKLEEWEWSDGFDCEVWRPLIRWTEQEVIDIHKRHGLGPNPLYLLGASRVGCWPCIYARKDEIRMIADRDPGRIDLLRMLEERVTEKARARYAEKGETFESRGYQEPSWFQAPLGGTGETWPIDKVVQWSRTSRGGRQLEIFASDPADAGCMRWGLCDTGEPK